MAKWSGKFINPDTLDRINWDEVNAALDHPFPVRLTPEAVIDARTNQVCARIEPGYRFYLAHRHLHVAPVDYFETTHVVEPEYT